MRVNITVTVDIDPESWTTNYGVEGAAAIRADVKEYVAGLVHTTLASVDVLVTP